MKFLFSLCLLLPLFLFGKNVHASNLPNVQPHTVYVSEKAGNWSYLPKMNASGNQTFVCLALADSVPYAVTLRGIENEFSLTLTNKSWRLSSKDTSKILLTALPFKLEKTFYPVDSLTLSTTLSPKEKETLIRQLIKNEKIHFQSQKGISFNLSLSGSHRILPLFQQCLKEVHTP
ncbi:hypothetical protein FAI40_07200 [Acetobacteraceae bacterium]|nr:hypothetical protein FAI40_07200 [Acetobacteraceae bacterium]